MNDMSWPRHRVSAFWPAHLLQRTSCVSTSAKGSPLCEKTLEASHAYLPLTAADEAPQSIAPQVAIHKMVHVSPSFLSQFPRSRVQDIQEGASFLLHCGLPFDAGKALPSPSEPCSSAHCTAMHHMLCVRVCRRAGPNEGLSKSLSRGATQSAVGACRRPPSAGAPESFPLERCRTQAQMSAKRRPLRLCMWLIWPLHAKAQPTLVF